MLAPNKQLKNTNLAVADNPGDRDLTFIVATPAFADITGKPRIIDGDTIEVAGERIRLHGIDAPESKQTCEWSKAAPGRCQSKIYYFARGSDSKFVPIDFLQFLGIEMGASLLS